MPVEDVRVGELFVVRPGEKVATEGVVVDGASAVDQSMAIEKSEELLAAVQRFAKTS